MRFVVPAYLTLEDFWLKGSSSIQKLAPGTFGLICAHTRVPESPEIDWAGTFEELFTKANGRPFEVR